jgi:hypothetical protein
MEIAALVPLYMVITSLLRLSFADAMTAGYVAAGEAALSVYPRAVRQPGCLVLYREELQRLSGIVE